MGKKILDIINSIVDEKSFIELNGSVVSKPLNPNKVNREDKGDGVLTGYCRIKDKLVFVYGQDESVLSGSLSTMQSKKIVSLYEKAIEVGAPIIGIYDNSGFRLDEGICGMYSLGNILKAQGRASGIIPQISIVLKNCGGISAILARSADFLFIEEKANLFVLSNGSEKDSKASELAEEGICDFCASESEIASKVVGLLDMIPQNCDNSEMYVETVDDLNRQTPSISSKEPRDMIVDIADNNIYYEVSKEFCMKVTSGFIKLNGQTIGVYSVLKPDKVCPHAFKKMTRFIKFCNLFKIPVLTIANAENLHACKEGGGDAALIDAIREYLLVYSQMSSPKVTLVKKAYGVAGMLLGSKTIGSDVVFAYDNSETGIMDEKSMIEMQYELELKSVGDKNQFINDKTAEIKNRDSVYSLAGEGYIDDIIDGSQTRQMLISVFEMLYTKM